MKTIIVKFDNQVFYLNEDNDWVCAHDSCAVEKDEVDTMREGEHDTYYQKVWVCNHCPAWQYVDFHYDGEMEDPKLEDWTE